MIYFDNAATTWPKPEAVYRAMDDFLRHKGANPGRGAHQMALEAGRVVGDTRQLLARFFNIGDPSRLVFTANVTEALNLAVKGLLAPGDHVVISGMEHNAVTRPVYALTGQGVSYSVAPCSRTGRLDLAALTALLRPETRMVCLVHASNVSGTFQPVAEVAGLTKKRGIALLVDSAQTAGHFAVDVPGLGIDLLAFTGHKGLFGPPGTGGLYIAPHLNPKPLKEGGTGGHSELKAQPETWPERYESGTLNTVGIAGLGAGVSFLTTTGLDNIRSHEENLMQVFFAGAAAVPGLTIYGPREPGTRAPVIAFNLQGWAPDELAFYLDRVYGIATRAGLHCAPLAHETLGTTGQGTVRISFSYFNTETEVEVLLQALKTLAGQGA